MGSRILLLMWLGHSSEVTEVRCENMRISPADADAEKEGGHFEVWVDEQCYHPRKLKVFRSK